MPYPLTSAMKQEGVKLTPDQLMESFVIDLASIEGYVAFYTSGSKIVSRDRDGIFPVTRILVGDYITVVGTASNDGVYQVNSVSANEIVVGSSLVNEGTVFVNLTNYLYYIRNEFSVYGFKMQGGSLINTNQLYYASNFNREQVSMELKSPSKGAVTRVSVSNVDRFIESLIQSRSYLRGCFLYMVLMYAKNFPSGAGYSYIGSSPDFQSNLVEKMLIDGVSSTDKSVAFDCSSKFNFKNFQLPSRLMDRNFCAWAVKYKGVECDPTNAINATTFPTCDGTLTQCRQRNNSKRFGAFPSIPKQAIYV